MPTSLNVRQTTLNWILFGLLFSALIGTGMALKMQLTAQGWVEHTLAVKTSLMEMLSTLQDAETGQRGFALSGDESFLEPFNAAQQKMDLRLQELERGISDNPIQLNKLNRCREPFWLENFRFQIEKAMIRENMDFQYSHVSWLCLTA